MRQDVIIKSNIGVPGVKQDAVAIKSHQFQHQLLHKKFPSVFMVLVIPVLVNRRNAGLTLILSDSRSLRS
jgi:hypothetical protein